MVTVPAVIPVTTPPDTLATAVLLLAHVPLVDPSESYSVIVPPAHRVVAQFIITAGPDDMLTTATSEHVPMV